MASKEPTLMVCRSCIRDNPQDDPALADEVVALIKKLGNPAEPLEPSEGLKPCLVLVRSQRDSAPGQGFIRADRVRLV